MTQLAPLALAEGLRAAVEDIDVTPGVVGFAATAIIAIVVVLLLLDMSRRVRRVNQRAMIREQLEAEAAQDARGFGAQQRDGADAAPAAPAAPASDEVPPAER